MFKKFADLFARSRGGGVVLGSGRATWMPARYDSYAREGYAQNVYVYACIKKIAGAIAGIPWRAMRVTADGPVEDANCRAARVISHPQPGESWTRLIEETVTMLLISGNAYLHDVHPGREIHSLQPNLVEIIAGDTCCPVAGYRYRNSDETFEFSPHEILHLKTVNPLDSWIGLPALSAASRSVDQNNAGRTWNVALLQQSARPSGILSTNEYLTDRQIDDMRRTLRESYSGATNAGTPLVLQGGLKWEKVSLTPDDMAWQEGMTMSAREICIAFGVPPEMLGDNGSKTYSNYREARRSFYLETVLPLLDWLSDEITRWLGNSFGTEKYIFTYHPDKIEALQEDREKLWTRTIEAVKAGVIERDEARKMLEIS
jgi:HK97 family phage portal protein